MTSQETYVVSMLADAFADYLDGHITADEAARAINEAREGLTDKARNDPR